MTNAGVAVIGGINRPYNNKITKVKGDHDNNENMCMPVCTGNHKGCFLIKVIHGEFTWL